jgi:hypothetical protein
MSKRSLWLASLVLAFGCGGGGGTGPSGQVLAVAGDYSGTVTIEQTGFPVETCPATVSVSQRGNIVVFTPMIEGGRCGNRRVDIGEWQFDQTGTLNSRAPNTVVIPDCGTVSASTRGMFSGSGRELRLTMTLSSSTCTILRTAILSR